MAKKMIVMLVVGLAFLALYGCKDEETIPSTSTTTMSTTVPTTTTATTTTPTTTTVSTTTTSVAASHTFTSTVFVSHSHTITLTPAEVTSPPAGGVSMQTS